MRGHFLIIPFLFAFASFLQLNYVASTVVSPEQILRPLVVSWLLIGLLICPAYWLTRDWDWAALLITVLVLGVFSSNSFFSVVFTFTIMVTVGWLAFIRLRRV